MKISCRQKGSRKREVKLPKIELKSIDGDILNWQTFWDQFESSVHSNVSLSDVDKFSYLKSLLEGPAEDCISGLTLTTENYQEAVELLKSRFGNTQLLINRYAESFDELKVIKSMNQVSELRLMYDRVEATVRNLKSIKIDANTYGAFLVPLLSKKLPQELKRIMSRSFKDEVWDFTKLMSIFKEELEAQERISLEAKCLQDDEYSTAILHVARDGDNRKKSKQFRKGKYNNNNNHDNCLFCAGNHGAKICSNVTDFRIKRSILKKNGRCYICFQKGHVGQNCSNSSYQCHRCGGRHHISICDSDQTNRPPSTPDNRVQDQQNVTGTSTNTSQVRPWTMPPNPQQTGYYQFIPFRSSSHLVTQQGQPVSPGVMASPNSLVRPPDPNVSSFIPQLQPGASSFAPIYSNNPPVVTNPYVPTTSCSSTNAEKSVLLCTGRGIVFHSSNESVSTCARLLFDDGSMDSFISETLQTKLNLPILRQKPVSVSGFGGVTSEFKEKADVVQLSVASYFGTPVIMEAIVVPVVCGPLPRQRPKSASLKYPHLQNLFISDFTDDPTMEVDILVGGDFYWSFMTGNIIKGPVPNSPTALQTTIGWVLSGQNSTPAGEDTQSMITVSLNTSTFEENMKAFWEVEESPTPVDDVMKSFKSDIQFNGKRYVVKLPFKIDHEFLPDNRRNCERRLNTLCKQLKKKPEQYKLYDQLFREYERDGIIEQVPRVEIGEPGKVCYLSHRPIVREDRETTKIRPVFDGSAAATADSPSLNDILHTGPNLLSLIYDVLLRFILRRIVVMSDIKQAFLNVEVHPDHVDFLRFLWRNDGNEEITVFRFLVVLFGLTPSPFLLLATIQHHCERMVNEGKIDQEFVSKFLKVLYMDDSINGGEDVNDAFDSYKKSKFLMQTAGFLLRKWCSNNKDVMKLIDDAEISAGEAPEKFLSQLKSVLGLTWDTETDEILFNFVKIIHTMHLNEATKRIVLSIVASFFDPLGYLTPITTQGKVIFQSLCKKNIKWDEIIPPDISESWNKFVTLITSIKTIRIKRCVIPEPIDKITNFQIHGFSDSSGIAYCAVIYVRVETSCGFVNVRFLTSKSKVVPLKKTKNTTIPRLELLSCVLLSKLVNTISSPLSDLPYNGVITCWNDNTSALGWIVYDKRDRGPWVQPRARKIREIVPTSNWRHVPGPLNPADIPTREISPDMMTPDSVWFKGPKFLYGNQESWPTLSIDEEDVLPDEKVVTRTTVVNVVVAENHLGKVLEIEKFSSLYRLYMVLSYVQRFVSNMIARVRGGPSKRGEISISEYREAEKRVIRYEQFHIQNNDKFTLLKRSLKLFFDEDRILRVKGRLENSALEYNMKYPILLRDSHFLKLQIFKSHFDIWHDRVKPTLSRLRTKFWVVRGRQIVKRTIGTCVTCKRHLEKGLLPPPSPALPESRVCADYCFETTGVDYAGPLLVKSIYRSSTSMNKAYICLFTCATSRAVHLELAPNLEADAFLRCLRRFFNRRGKPSLLIDDNATTFKAKSVKSFLFQHGIEHSPILPASPWWGGFYERLVRSVKTPLKKVVGTAKLNYEEMETCLIEIEGIINTRPLTYLYEDDVSEPLTPSHLLMGRNLSTTPEPTSESATTTNDHEAMTNRFKYIQSVLRSSWKNFRHHYLTELREHHMYTRQKTNANAGLKLGDVVVIKDDDVR